MRKKLNNNIIINPGSVGQPRGRGTKGAQWCVFDTINCKVFFKETIYKKNNILKLIKKNDPKNIYLRKVLLR